jgi:hypothetical protein
MQDELLQELAELEEAELNEIAENAPSLTTTAAAPTAAADKASASGGPETVFKLPQAPSGPVKVRYALRAPRTPRFTPYSRDH